MDGYVARKVEKTHTTYSMKNIKERHNLENVGVDERTTLKYMLKKQGGNAFTGCCYLKNASGAVFCDHDDEPSCSITTDNFMTNSVIM
jgi:hypothetical protein